MTLRRPLLVPMAMLSTVASLAGWWLHTEVLDEDAWSANLGSLLDDDQIATEVADILTDRVVATTVDELVDVPLAPDSLEAPVRERLTEELRPVVQRLVRTEAASAAWRAAIESAHDDMVALVRDDTTSLVDDATIRVDLGPLAERVSEAVTDVVDDALGLIGLSGPAAPDLDLQIVLYDFEDQETALRAADLLDRGRGATAVLAVVAGLAMIGPRRRRATWAVIAALTGIWGALVFQAAVRSREPDGLANTWDALADTSADLVAMVVSAGLLAIVAAIAAAVLAGTTRGRRRPA